MEIIPSLSLCFIALSFFTSPILASSSGFSVNLIHRDSPLSPYYNPSKTYYENLRNSLHRSMTRTSRIFAPKLASSPITIQSPFTADPGDYLMKISLGTPPQEFVAIADTGSDLTWIQCRPCVECYRQKDLLFYPKRSSTYKKQPCQSKACLSIPQQNCADKKYCNYEMTYGDGSFSMGDLSLESFTFKTTSGKPIVLPKVTFGCGHSSGGNFDNLTDGIVGLGNGGLSIVNQLNDTIHGKFSYCMVPQKLNVSSKIKFGSHAVVSGSGVQKTPIFTQDLDTFYYLNLKSVSVGDKNIKFDTKTYTNNVNDNDGNIIIDSGTTLTYLPNGVYQKIEYEIKRIIPAKPVKKDQDLKLCYKNEKGLKEKVPNITFHFTGADWELSVLNTMLEIEDVICFTIASADDTGGQPIFGNMQQMNYWVGYDLNGKTLSFKKTDCTKH